MHTCMHVLIMSELERSFTIHLAVCADSTVMTTSSHWLQYFVVIIVNPLRLLWDYLLYWNSVSEHSFYSSLAKWHAGQHSRLCGKYRSTVGSHWLQFFSARIDFDL